MVLLQGYFGAHLSKLKGNILVKKTFTLVCLSVGVSLTIKALKNFLLINYSWIIWKLSFKIEQIKQEQLEG